MKLLEPTKLGNLSLKNKMVMAAMTRSRADINGIVSDLTVAYYTQRASAGLLLTEGINISPDALGSPFTPGLFTKEQTAAWKKVTQAVHEADGKIIAQLWHTGRVGHSVDKNGKLPVAPSAIAIEGIQHFTSQGMRDFETPRTMTIDEIKQTIKDYGNAARNAMEAGFDGVELHGANGYLPHQFLAESANQRTDQYGGSIENKSRFFLEVMQELIKAVGRERVGVKISPLNPYNGIALDNPVATFTYLIEELNKLDIAFIELSKRNQFFPLLPHYPKEEEIELFGKLSKSVIIANSEYGRETAEAEIEKGIAELVSFGAIFLANPDLPLRFQLNAPLNTPDRNTFFAGGEKGYTDYPFLEQES